MTKERNKYFDFLRGLAIMAVVGIHTFIMPDTQDGTGRIEIFERELLNFAVPLFLAISGFFLSRRNVSSKNLYFSFLKQQIAKVYIPCLVWSIPFLVLSSYANGYSWKYVILMFTCSYTIFYFIALIIQMYLMLPVMQMIGDKLWRVALSVIITLSSVCLLNYCFFVDRYPLVIRVGPFVYWLMFFVMGVYFGRHKRNYSLFWPIILTIVGLVMQNIESYSLIKSGREGVGIKITAWGYSAGIILLLFSLKIEKTYKDNLFMNCVKHIGELSFGIYLTHLFFIMLLSSIMPTFDWFAKWVFSLMLTVAFISIAKKLFPNVSDKYLGFNK